MYVVELSVVLPSLTNLIWHPQ